MTTEFWEDKHQSQDRYWLTDSKPEEVLKMHNLEKEFKECRSFLDIGVGFGGMTRYVKSVPKKFVYSSDISQSALDRLSSISDQTVLIQDISKSIEPVDLAVCHLVLQHCDNETMTHILNDVPLKSDSGILSVQFACLRPSDKANGTVQDLLDRGTHFLRSLSEFERIVGEKTDKEIVSISKPKDFYKPENLRWYFCKLKRKKNVEAHTK